MIARALTNLANNPKNLNKGGGIKDKDDIDGHLRILRRYQKYLMENVALYAAKCSDPEKTPDQQTCGVACTTGLVLVVILGTAMLICGGPKLGGQFGGQMKPAPAMTPMGATGGDDGV